MFIFQKLWVDAVYYPGDSTFTFAGSGDTILARDGRPLVGSMAEVGISLETIDQMRGLDLLRLILTRSTTLLPDKEEETEEDTEVIL